MPEQKEQRQWPRCSGRHVIPSGDVTGAAEWLPVRIGSSSGFLSAAAGDDERRPQRRSGLPVRTKVVGVSEASPRLSR